MANLEQRIQSLELAFSKGNLTADRQDLERSTRLQVFAGPDPVFDVYVRVTDEGTHYAFVKQGRVVPAGFGERDPAPFSRAKQGDTHYVQDGNRRSISYIQLEIQNLVSEHHYTPPDPRVDESDAERLVDALQALLDEQPDRDPARVIAELLAENLEPDLVETLIEKSEQAAGPKR